MSPSPKSQLQAATRVKSRLRQHRRPVSKLNSMTACDTAFRILALRYLGDLTANHEATCKGDPEALHQMRVVLTRLRTAVLFFSPMVVDSQQPRVKGELKWLNTNLGVVRDLDVAIERLQAIPDYQSWVTRRADSHKSLARTLQSARYRRLTKITSNWIENGPWSIKKGKQASKQRACSIASYSTDKLARWQQKLLKKSRELLKLDTKKRHRLRLLNKKLTYSVEFLEDLFADKRFSRQQAALKYLRKAQKSLGQLNDDANSRSLATALQREGVEASLQFLGAEREKRLLRRAAAAYRKLAKLKPVGA